MVKFQYQDFNNVDIGQGGYSPSHGNFCTIGIKDHTNTIGLEYTFNNQYPSAAAPITKFFSSVDYYSSSSIRITFSGIE